MTKPETPMLTVDIIIEVEGGIVLIERKNEPFGWALPGGCVDIGETCINAAIREAEEETGLKIENVVRLGMYDDPDRDPRGHAVSIAYSATAKGLPVAGSDAKKVIVRNPYELKTDKNLCFDHGQIIEEYLIFQRKY